MQESCSCRQLKTFCSFLEKQLQNQTCLTLGKVFPLRFYHIWMKILSGHEKTIIYAAVGRIFEILFFSQNFVSLQKIENFCQFQNFKNPPHISVEIGLLMNISNFCPDPIKFKGANLSQSEACLVLQLFFYKSGKLL